MGNKGKRLWQHFMMIMLVLCMVCGSGITAYADDAVASNMRLKKAQGTVSVTNKNGRDMGTKDDMKLFNGYQLTTADISYAWINLDDTKLVKMDSASEVEIQKRGKNLEVLLNSGNLFFNVSEPLKTDETLKVRTSTMVTGIRGTSIAVKVVDSTRTQIYAMSGRVECFVMDPITGETKTTFLNAGETAEFVVYEQDHVGDKCEIIMNRVNEDTIDGFVAVELINDPELYKTVQETLPELNLETVTKNAEAKLKQTEQTVKTQIQVATKQMEEQIEEQIEQKQKEEKEQAKQQGASAVVDPLFGNQNNNDTSGDAGSDSSGPSAPTPDDPDPDDPTPDDPTPDDPDTDDTDDSEPTESTVIRLTVTEAESSLNEYLAQTEQAIEIIVSPGEDGDSNLNLSSVTKLSENQKMTLEGVNLVVEESAELYVDDTLTVNGNVINNGVIVNRSMESLIVYGSITNTYTIDNSGKIEADAIKNEVSFYNTGNVYANEVVNEGTFINEVTTEVRGMIDIQTIINEAVCLIDNSGDLKAEVIYNYGTFTNSGNESYANVNSFENQGSLNNEGHISVSVDMMNANNIDNQGSIEAMNIDTTGPTFYNSGDINSNLFITNGSLSMMDGTVTGTIAIRGSESEVNINGGEVGVVMIYAGNLNIGGDAIVTEGLDIRTIEATVSTNGGTIRAGAGYQAAIVVGLEGGAADMPDTGVEAGQSNLRVRGNTIVDGGMEDDELKPSVWVNDGTVEIENGTLETGLVVKGENPTVNISGGTIYAGAEAAIVLDSTTPITAPDTSGDGSGADEGPADLGSLSNINLTGGVIDGGDKPAILIKRGNMLVDMTRDDNWGENPEITGSDPKNLISVRDGMSYLLLKETDGNHQFLSSDHVLCTPNGDQYTLKYTYGESDLLEMIVNMKDDDYLKLNASENNEILNLVEPGTGMINIPAPTTSGNMPTLDLNGRTLVIDTELYIGHHEPTTQPEEQRYAFKICDTNENKQGVLECASIFNFEGLEIETITLKTKSIENIGELVMYDVNCNLPLESISTEKVMNFITNLDTMSIENSEIDSSGYPAIYNEPLSRATIVNSNISYVQKPSDLDSNLVGSLVSNYGTMSITGGTIDGKEYTAIFNAYRGELTLCDGAEIRSENQYRTMESGMLVTDFELDENYGIPTNATEIIAADSRVVYGELKFVVSSTDTPVIIVNTNENENVQALAIENYLEGYWCSDQNNQGVPYPALNPGEYLNIDTTQVIVKAKSAQGLLKEVVHGKLYYYDESNESYVQEANAFSDNATAADGLTNYTASDGPDGNGDYILIANPETATISSGLAMFSTAKKSETMKPDAEKATDSNARLKRATESNISDADDSTGTSAENAPLTTSAAAIPMAATMLALFMGVSKVSGFGKKSKKEHENE